jgi:hypothetical protein
MNYRTDSIPANVYKGRGGTLIDPVRGVFATSVGEMKQILNASGVEDRQLIFVWRGQYTSDAFIVNLEEAREALR